MIRFKSAVAGFALGLAACAGMSNAPAKFTGGVW